MTATRSLVRLMARRAPAPRRRGTQLLALIAAGLVCGLPIPPAVAYTQPVETLGEVRVHGNHTTPEADILAIAGLTVGAPVTDAIIEAAAEKLRASGRFDNVDVRKRFRSISDPSDILVIIVVDERPGVSDVNLMPGPMKRLTSAGMWLPVINYADGYGFTYGARISFVDLLGARSRVSVPLTWGGERRAALEVDKPLTRGPLTRVQGEVALFRRRNPYFDLGDTRTEGRVRAERELTSWLRAGGGVRLTQVRFGALDETHLAPEIEVAVDTRTDPAYPRNAVHAVVKWEQLRFDDDRAIGRTTADLRGYVGLFRSTVLALRAAVRQASDPLPPYELALLGGTASLRGYRVGYRADDNLATASAEIRVPLTSPLDIGRLGMKAFVDFGTVYPDGAKLSGQLWDRGIGLGVFMTAPIFRIDLDVAKPRSGDVRVHFGLGVTF